MENLTVSIPRHSLPMSHRLALVIFDLVFTKSSGFKGYGFDTGSGHLLSCLLPLFQGKQLSVTGEST